MRLVECSHGTGFLGYFSFHLLGEGVEGSQRGALGMASLFDFLADLFLADLFLDIKQASKPYAVLVADFLSLDSATCFPIAASFFP